MGVWQSGHKKNLKEKRREAPFATAFSLNPYARALSEPVSQCTFTGVRLPRSCLQVFHLIENESGDEHSLLPLSLAAEMIPKKKPEHRRTRTEKDLHKTVQQEASSIHPTGSASYMVNYQGAIDHISQDPQKRLFRFGMGRRLAETTLKLGINRSVKWRPDMPEYVLTAMRRVVKKKLSYHFQSKRVPDAVGPLQALPGMAGLERLNDVDDVMCVLKLTPPEPTEELGSMHGQGSPAAANNAAMEEDAELEELFRLDYENRSAAGETEELDDRDDDIYGAVGAEDAEFSRDADEASEIHASVIDSQTEEAPIDTPEDSQAARPNDTVDSATSEEPARPIKFGSATHKTHSGPWSPTEDASFLGRLHRLPPPRKRSVLYFPTLRYRNRRVPVYSLPLLLGQRMTDELVRPTVFKETEYVVLTLSPATVEAQVWLLKLSALGAGEKEGSVRL